MTKAALSVEDFCRAYSVGKTTAYEEISSGRLRAVKAGRRTLIPDQAAIDWLKSLEPVAAHAA
jgi:excisionase family DNA binding protein